MKSSGELKQLVGCNLHNKNLFIKIKKREKKRIELKLNIFFIDRKYYILSLEILFFVNSKNWN